MNNHDLTEFITRTRVQGAPRVVVGLSGGVDSSVAAWLLKQQGYDVIGLFMKNWEDDDDDAYCSTRQDWLDAVSVADKIGIDIEAVNFASDYKDRVFAEFLREYSAGRTPNPDVLCNAEIKFKSFLDHAMRMGAAQIATGHYARVREVPILDSSDVPARLTNPIHPAHTKSEFQLLKAHDASKDQSYFLHRLNQAQLSKTLFPLGELHKTQVRAIAEQLGLHNARKKDSTGICFIGERPFRDFLNRYLPTQTGPMKNAEGKVLGQHMGLAFYTLGQRKGIGLGGDKNGSGEPWFVARKERASNTLYVVQGHQHPWLLSHTLQTEQTHWIAARAPIFGIGTAPRYAAKSRYRQADAPCTLAAAQGAQFTLHFAQAQWAVTPGQSAVLYQGEVCLGGGIIAASA